MDVVVGKPKFAFEGQNARYLDVDSEYCPLTVLGPQTITLSCSFRQLVGCRAILSLSADIQQGNCVEITWNDALLFGEVIACWNDGSGAWAAVELEHALVGIEHLRSICNDFTA